MFEGDAELQREQAEARFRIGLARFGRRRSRRAGDFEVAAPLHLGPQRARWFSSTSAGAYRRPPRNGALNAPAWRRRADEKPSGARWAEVKRGSDFDRRRAEIDAFNRAIPILKRGLGLFPLKLGISSTFRT